MSHMQIKNWITGAVIYEGEAESLKDLVGSAIKAQANLSSADLSSADLRYADLSSADLSSADLRYADLSSANLRSANLSYADLRSANLRSADLRSANLRYADLRSADLRSADLRYADLSSANLRSADLRSADLRYADLSSANLGKQHVFSFSGIGSVRRVTNYWVEAKEITCGCFRGTPNEFITRVEKTHANNPKHLAEYRAGIAFFRACLKAIPKDELAASRKEHADMIAKKEAQ